MAGRQHHGSHFTRRWARFVSDTHLAGWPRVAACASSGPSLLAFASCSCPGPWNPSAGSRSHPAPCLLVLRLELAWGERVRTEGTLQLLGEWRHLLPAEPDPPRAPGLERLPRRAARVRPRVHNAVLHVGSPPRSSWRPRWSATPRSPVAWRWWCGALRFGMAAWRSAFDGVTAAAALPGPRRSR